MDKENVKIQHEDGVTVNVKVDVVGIKEVLSEKVNSITELLDIQRTNCVDKYNIGIYNGLILARSVITGEEPKYFEMEETNNE